MRRVPAIAWAAGAAVSLHAALLAVAGLPLAPASPPAPRGVLQAWLLTDTATVATATAVERGGALPALALAPATLSESPAAEPARPVAANPRPPDPAVPEIRPWTHWPSSALERAALPFSAPDDTLLDGVAATGLPLRLRLYIEADGRVSSVQVLQASEFDREAAARLQEMFLATAFVPGRVDGRDVASFMDIEVVPAATTANVPALSMAPSE